MWTTDDILRTDDFGTVPHSELLDIILVLRTDLKYHKYKKDYQLEQLQSTINVLQGQKTEKEKEVERLKAAIGNFHKKIGGRLSIMERIKGRIDLSK